MRREAIKKQTVMIILADQDILYVYNTLNVPHPVLDSPYIFIQ